MKASRLVIRFNTVRNCPAQLTLRHGNFCEVYGNYFLNTLACAFSVTITGSTATTMKVAACMTPISEMVTEKWPMETRLRCMTVRTTV